MDLNDYHAGDFNDDGSLKVPPLLWCLLLFLNRHVLVLILAALSTFMLSRSGTQVDFSTWFSSPLLLPASLPAIAVLTVALRRSPRSGSHSRVIWRTGRQWLIVAAVVDMGLLLSGIYWHWITLSEWVIAAGLIDFYAIVYLLRSRRVRDTFADFPTTTASRDP